jgi:Protein of unknown function (DUF5674)
MNSWDTIMVLDARIDIHDLRRLVREGYGDMVKFVVDIRQERIAIGGDLHADGEALLLERGSRQQDLWGGNYYPGRGPDECIEYTSMINIRPNMENLGMELSIEPARTRLRELAHRLVGQGEVI